MKSRIASGTSSWDWPTSRTKVFRYRSLCAIDISLRYAKLRFEVTLPSLLNVTVNREYSDACEVSGCRHLSLQCSPDDCQPPPSPSRMVQQSLRATQSNAFRSSGTFEDSQPLPNSDSLRPPHRPPTPHGRADQQRGAPSDRTV
jgi:hypothetical protein